ncbi:MAG: DUF3795 domain-containing protein [Candidatus Hodarchaeales archaeon]
MESDSLAAACGLYCGFCRYYMNESCKGCGSEDRADCTLLKCCRIDKGLVFCSECDEFPCKSLKSSTSLHPKWLEDLAKQPLKKS